MNTKLVNTAAGVIHAAMQNGKQTPTGIAFDLESAQLLQPPETAAELARLRKYAENRQSREEELLATLGQYDLASSPEAWDLGMTVIAHLEGPHRPAAPEELVPGLRRLIEQLSARASELMTKLAEYERPVDQGPIAFGMTVEASCGRALATGEPCPDHPTPQYAEVLTPKVQQVHDRIAAESEQAGGAS